MQVITYMTRSYRRLRQRGPNLDSVAVTRQRLLNAAFQSFSRDGFHGATTREIARRAKVNEVTLFRHFRNKKQLLRAVLEHGLARDTALIESLTWNQDLRKHVAEYARHYLHHLEEREAFVRALVAEVRFLPSSVRQICAEVIGPLRQRLIDSLNRAQRGGLVREDVNIECAIDILRDALYSRMLRQGGFLPGNYSREAYLESLVDIFVRGIETQS
jgi:AcrR family transcriptional regulator